ncbi:uncharacterized protein N7458_001046 [Penicillium daleae]|uniref:Xylanolytic transcriptional activator regulatory domain-containing protein n=1 Tax=Penicillium daleae TaxID=63821 RepID=A0AAD6CA61_9EURO|nr:uncharacterized protein N7458_001046 [Penicillium daleae]KAJ5459494.1 hypothetical protein N7458_001046 [Penicillium daleae]
MTTSNPNSQALEAKEHQGKPMAERWYLWIKEEQNRRLAWFVYEYDYFVFQMYRTRPYLNICDLTSDLPCYAAFWEAETPQAWDTIQPWTIVPQSRPPSELGSLLVGPLSVSHSRLNWTDKLQALLILLRRFCNIIDLTRGDWVGRLCHSYGSKDGIEEILKAMDLLADVTSNDLKSALLSNEELVCKARALQMVHMAHLHSAGRLMVLVKKICNLELNPDDAFEEILKWGNDNERKAREIAFHSAQILGIVRSHPLNSPSEMSNTFNSGIALFFLSKRAAYRWIVFQ